MAIKSSFKQPCPSCEAMVPIRDPKLIGRKIDCPKCKYRFIVEEPVEDVEEEVEEEPAKKGKSAAVTNKKPANGKADPQRRPDDDEDEGEALPKKKKSGGSGMLIAGIGLAAIAIVALAVGAVFLFTGGDKSEPKKSSGGPSAGTTPANGPAGGNGQQGQQPDKAKNDPKPKQEDVTNLMPNDAQVVVNLPLEQLFGNSKVKQALLHTPGAFYEAAFQRVWGIAPTDVHRVVLAYNVEKKTVFSVMRTSKQISEEKIVAGLKLKAEAPIGALKYYLVAKPLDALSTFLLKGGEPHDKVALHFIDSFTVVCADLGPMNQFLQEKGQPKALSKQLVEEPQGGNKPGGGMPGGGMPGGGMPGGPPRMPGGPQPGGGPKPAGGQQQPGGGQQQPGGGPKPAGGQQQPGGGQQQPGGNRPPGAPGGGGQAPAPGGAPRGGGPGGFQPPGGMPPGMRPSGMFPGGGGISDAAPVSSSYMTIDPQLKAVLDQVEKVDANESQNVLLSLAFSTTALSVEDFKKFLSQQGNGVPQLPDAVLKLGLETFQSQLKAAALAVTQFNESKVVANAAVGVRDAKLAEEWKKEADTLVAGFLLTSGLDLVSKNAGRGNLPGMPGGPRPGGFPQGPGPQGGGQPFPPPGQGPRPGGFPGMQPPNGDKQEEKGKQGEYLFWTKGNVLAFGVNLNIKSDHYKVAGQVLEYVGIFLRGVTAMSDRHSRIHELAAAIQAYHDKEGHFPCGTLTPKIDDLHVLGWRPDQRRSWMTLLLPYLGNGEFQGMKFDLDKAWYEEETNQKAGFTIIPQFVASIQPDDLNSVYVEYPNLSVKGPGRWAATHFVGIAGVGLDAVEYRDGDAATAKLRGVFGYDRETKKDDIKDGADQTIAVIQVPTAPKSPWIAGGGSTVRGVSDDLDCVRPFVCTKYKNKDGKEEDGTFAIMADGKVRFIPASIDPKTFQAMCTIAGGEKIKDIDSIAPEVPPPEDLLQQPELKAEQPAPVAVNPPVQPQKPNPAVVPPDAKSR